ncbi:hypothetical protein N9Y92_04730 [Chlamydiales bacterium]|nr:hypothetical protein [Chlamydiales bacterium]
MEITGEEVIDLMNEFHEVVRVDKSNVQGQKELFLYPDPKLFILHGKDLTLEELSKIHQNLEDELYIPQKQWTLTPLSKDPQKARFVGALYWEGTIKNTSDRLKCLVGEDWIVQRVPSGKLKIAVYTNHFIYFLPDSCQIPDPSIVD